MTHLLAALDRDGLGLGRLSDLGCLIADHRGGLSSSDLGCGSVLRSLVFTGVGILLADVLDEGGESGGDSTLGFLCLDLKISVWISTEVGELTYILVSGCGLGFGLHDRFNGSSSGLARGVS